MKTKLKRLKMKMMQFMREQSMFFLMKTAMNFCLEF